MVTSKGVLDNNRIFNLLCVFIADLAIFSIKILTFLKLLKLTVLQCFRNLYPDLGRLKWVKWPTKTRVDASPWSWKSFRSVEILLDLGKPSESWKSFWILGNLLNLGNPFGSWKTFWILEILLDLGRNMLPFFFQQKLDPDLCIRKLFRILNKVWIRIRTHWIWRLIMAC